MLSDGERLPLIAKPKKKRKKAAKQLAKAILAVLEAKQAAEQTQADDAEASMIDRYLLVAHHDVVIAAARSTLVLRLLVRFPEGRISQGHQSQPQWWGMASG